MMRDRLSQLRRSRVAALAAGTAVPVDFRVTGPSAAGSGDKAHMHIYDMIDDWFGVSASMVVEALLAADGRDLVVHINSPGGSVIEGLAIYNNLRAYPHDVEIRIEGGALSAASFVALAGNRTLIEPAALMMLHDAWDVTAGNAADHRKAADVLDQASETMAGIYARKAGGSQADWRDVLRAEKWYQAQEAVDAGLVDAVLPDETAGATAKWVASAQPVVTQSPAATTSALSSVDIDALRESLKGAFA
jgi:ATP-dependent protease ClpP protease subunit